jgi:hypothetical protein
MKTARVYVDLDGNEIALDGLDAQERRLLARLQRRARTHPDWCAFDNYRMPALIEFYDGRGVSRKALVRTPLWRIAQDLSSRLGIAAGLIREPDYRDDLEDLIREQYPSRRAFCQATGLTKEALNDFLAGRADLSLAELTRALEQIGYRLHIIAAPQRKKTG